MMRWSTLLLAACGPHALPTTTATGCAAHGEPIQWSALVCMFREETDDFDAPQVGSCMEPHRARIDADPCSFVIDAKQELCATLATWGRYDGDAERCAADPTLVPCHDGPMLTLHVAAAPGRPARCDR